MEEFCRATTAREINLSNCGGQCYDKEANIKGKAGLQARFLQINSKALYVAVLNHSLNLAVEKAQNFPLKHCYFLGVDSIAHTLFVFNATLDHTKEKCAAITQVAICYLLGEPDPLHLIFALLFGCAQSFKRIDKLSLRKREW